MYTLFILFFASLIGIIIMVTRKLAFVRHAQILGRDDVLHPFDPDLEKLKHLAKRGAKEYSYLALVATIRLYIKSFNFIKSSAKKTTTTVKGLINRTTNSSVDSGESAGADNGFLKKVTEYKKKIRQIKHKIHREEEEKQ